MIFREKVKPDQLINGTFGKVWINSEKLATVQSLSAKQGFDFEEVTIGEELGVGYKLVSTSGSGTLTLLKVDSGVLKLYGDVEKTGKLPDITIVASVEDPASFGAQRVQFLNVVFEEISIMEFTKKEIAEEEIPFKFTGFIKLDLI